MGRRTRRRMATPGARPAPATPKPPLPGRNTPPPAPWSPFPLIELAILIGLVMIVAGFLSRGSRGHVLLGCGLGLASLATLEQTIREHFAGFRSHASLLAGAGAVGVAAALYAFTRLAQPLPLLIAAAVFATLWQLLRAAHRRVRAGPGQGPPKT